MCGLKSECAGKNLPRFLAWATVSLGSLDDSVVSVATSPSGLTMNGGSVNLASLSDNLLFL